MFVWSGVGHQWERVLATSERECWNHYSSIYPLPFGVGVRLKEDLRTPIHPPTPSHFQELTKANYMFYNTKQKKKVFPFLSFQKVEEKKSTTPNSHLTLNMKKIIIFFICVRETRCICVLFHFYFVSVTAARRDRLTGYCDVLLCSALSHSLSWHVADSDSGTWQYAEERCRCRWERRREAVSVLLRVGIYTEWEQ